MAQPMNKWIEELEEELILLNEEIRERSMELQRKDPVINEMFQRHAQKQGALDYLKSKEDKTVEEAKPKKRKRKKALVDKLQE